MIYSQGRRSMCTTCSRMRFSYQQVLAMNSKKDLFCRFEYAHVAVVVVVVVSIDHSTAVESGAVRRSCAMYCHHHCARFSAHKQNPKVFR